MYWAGDDVSAGLAVVSVLEAVTVAGLGVCVVRYAVPFGTGAGPR